MKKVTATDLRQNLRVHLKAANANTVVLVENRRQPAKYLVDKDFLDSLMKERESILATLEILADRELADRLLKLSKSIDEDVRGGRLLKTADVFVNKRKSKMSNEFAKENDNSSESEPEPHQKVRVKPPFFELRYTTDAAADILAASTAAFGNNSTKCSRKNWQFDPEGYGLPLRGPLRNYWKHEFWILTASFTGFILRSAWWWSALWEFRKHGDAEDIYRQLESVAKTGRLAEQLAAVIKNLLP